MDSNLNGVGTDFGDEFSDEFGEEFDNLSGYEFVAFGSVIISCKVRYCFHLTGHSGLDSSKKTETGS